MAKSKSDVTSNNALVELQIPGATGPLPSPPANAGETLWGINHGAALDNFPQHGLQLYIPAWQRMGVGDSVKVMLDSQLVQSETIVAEEVNQRVTTFINARHLETAQERRTVHYVVTRFGQTPEPSAPTQVLVKLDRPGGKDQDGDNPGHSELKFSIPQDIINDGVDADTARDGVPVTIAAYPNMAAMDTIKLSWGGQFLYHEVIASEVGKSIVMTVDEATIKQAGDSGANGLAVTYELYDTVQNRSEDWADEERITVDTGNSRLSALIVEEAYDNVLDLNQLGDKAATAQIIVRQKNSVFGAEQNAQFAEALSHASLGKETVETLAALNGDFARGDKLVVMLRGTTVDGAEVSYDSPETVIEYLNKIYSIPVPNSHIRRLAKTQAVFSYRVIHLDGSVESRSKGTFINIVGEAVRLPAPIAKDASQGAIDPALTSTRIEVPWDDSMAMGDQVTLKWLGTRPDFSIYDPQITPRTISRQDEANKQPIIFTVNGSHLTAIEGGTLVLSYLLEQDVGDSVVSRESAPAAELNVGAPRNELPAPLVPEVVNGALDPSLSSATLTVPNYTDKAKNDEIIILWKGSVSGPYTDSILVTNRNLTTPISFTIADTAIKPNDQGNVDASYEVKRYDDRTSYSDITHFDVGQARLDPPDIDSLTDSKGQTIPDNGSTFDTTVTVAGTAAADQSVEVFDGSVSKGTANADAQGAWTLTLRDLTTGSHAIKAVAKYGEGAESSVRRFTIASSVVPAISNIKDSKDQDIPANGSTVDTTVTVTGTAAANESVEVFDNAASKGRPQADANGVWTLTLNGLAAGPHAIKAVAQYGNGGESAVQSFTVSVVTSVGITQVTDSKGVPIANGGTTTDTNLTISGVVMYSN